MPRRHPIQCFTARQPCRRDDPRGGFFHYSPRPSRLTITREQDG